MLLRQNCRNNGGDGTNGDSTNCEITSGVANTTGATDTTGAADTAGGANTTGAINTTGAANTIRGPEKGGAHSRGPGNVGCGCRAGKKRVCGAGDGSDRRDGGRAAQADVVATPADKNHRSSAADSSGITEDDHNVYSGRDRHSIPGVRSTSDFGESRSNETISTTIVERLEKTSQFWSHNESRYTDKAERC